jgi:hypothetical protein
MHDVDPLNLRFASPERRNPCQKGRRLAPRLTHVYSKNDKSAKIFHHLMQIAHLLMQLLIKGSLMRRCFPGRMGSVKNVAFRLLEALRNAHMPEGVLHWITQRRLQIRFCPDTS